MNHLYLNYKFKNYIPTSEKTHRVFNIQNSLLMPSRESSLFILTIIQNKFEKNAELLMFRKMVYMVTTVL